MAGTGATDRAENRRMPRWLVRAALVVVVIVVLGFVLLTFLGRQVANILNGTVEFGTGGVGCQVEGLASTFTTGQNVHVVAHLNREVRAGEIVTVTLSQDGTQIDTGETAIGETATCITGTIPAGGFPAGHLELRYSIGSETLSRGSVDVTAP